MKKFKSNGATFNLIEENDFNPIKNIFKSTDFKIMTFSIPDAANRNLAFYLNSNEMSNGFATILGRRNGTNGPIMATMSAFYSNNKVQVFAEGTLKDQWSKNDSARNIWISLEAYSSGIIIYTGFNNVTIG